jgi:hypothetical protein
MALLLATVAMTGTIIGTQFVHAWHHGHHGGHVSTMPSGGGSSSGGGGGGGY